MVAYIEFNIIHYFHVGEVNPLYLRKDQLTTHSCNRGDLKLITGSPPQVVHHPADVPGVLPVLGAQHGLRGAYLHQPLHWHQRQRGHLRPGAVRGRGTKDGSHCNQ